MWMLLLLIVSAANASSRKDKIFQLIIKLQNLTGRLDLPELKASATPTIKPMTAKTNPPEYVNFAKRLNFSNSGFNSPDHLTIFEDTLKAEKKSKGVFWTSGIFSKECDAYIWCPEMEIIGETPLMKWRKGFPNREFGDCLAVQTSQDSPDDNGLFNQNCSAGSPEVMAD
ncbi:Hypothetical predicted protein [Cloeon dipterum]|uniref:Uncharacterized protein n=1 Tax=Cloeon dipterum TaxID=197152 RepID=A0A8S1E0Z4_9INSE|nr:Hypothetical predicted protein [Cloeon dipterum]